MTTSTLAGKVAVITGGARGIGLATALALHRQGVRVAIGDIDDVTARQAGATHGFAVVGTVDVTDPDSFAAFLARVEEELGSLDVLINNAGIMPAGRLVDESDGLTRRILDINLYGVIVGSKLAAQRMVPQGHGHIVNVASLAGETPTPGLATYCATKAAVLSFTESARLEYRETGVHFSAVLPTFVNTELTAGTPAPLGLDVEPEDIADAIVALLRKPAPRVAVSRLAGMLIAAQKFVPRAIGEFVTRRAGLAHLFVDGVDHAARSAYEARARGNADLH